MNRKTVIAPGEIVYVKCEIQRVEIDYNVNEEKAIKYVCAPIDWESMDDIFRTYKTNIVEDINE